MDRVKKEVVVVSRESQAMAVRQEEELAELRRQVSGVQRVEK
jgi:hypothetical protein